MECLVREFREETGLPISVGSVIGEGVLTIGPPHVCEARDVWIVAYGCHLGEEGASVRWQSAMSITTLPGFPFVNYLP